MKNFRHIALLVSLFAVASCGGRGQKGGEQTSAEEPVRAFPAVEIPGIYDNAADQMDYLASHYWDKCFDTTSAWLNDSTHVDGVAKADMEQAFANYVYVLDNVGMDTARKSVRMFYGRISDSAFDGMRDIVDRYLYDPNSPLRNEDYYQPFAELLSKDSRTPEDLRDSYAYDAKTCLLNQIGTKAADFHFCDKDGLTYSLYGIDAKYTLLFFSNPGCNACKEIIDNLRSNPKVDAMIAGGDLAVVNVYIDEDTEAWYGYMSYYPDNWYNGYDPNLVIRTDLLYNVRAIPSLYLLDKDKVVMMKDAPEEKVFNFIDNYE